MNGKNLFVCMNYIDDQYVEEAEFCDISYEHPHIRGKNTPSRPRPLRRSLLLAAAIAMALLLVGCAVVYVMHMQDLTVDERTAGARPVEGSRITDETVAVIQQILTMGGAGGTDAYRAAQEWYEFKQNYDPDHLIQVKLAQEGALPEYPAEYGAYQIYTQEMKDKLDEIVAKYGLKLAGTRVQSRTFQQLCKAMGMETVLTPGSDSSIRIRGAGAYACGNMNMDVEIDLAGGEGEDPFVTMGQLYYRRKDCFCEDMLSVGGGLLMGEDTGTKEWNYTTKSGKNVLILRSPSDWRAWLFCDGREYMISVMVEARQEYYSDDLEGNAYMDAVEMTDRQLERLADAIDFTREPKPVPEGVDLSAGEVSTGANQNGYTLELESAVSDGRVGTVVLRLTGPEYMALNEIDIQPGNWWNYFTPKTGENRAYPRMETREDGDGLANTVELVASVEFDEPIAQGETWEVYIQDLTDTQGNVTTWTVEGLWQIDVTFDEGGFQELELVREPITVSASTGWREDGTDVYEDVTLKSFTLRSQSAHYECDPPYADIRPKGEDIPVVLKDGSQILIDVFLKPERDIPLDEVDYVLLPDGTRLNAE